MAINKVKTTEEEQHFKFLSNQSSILRTVDTNNITVNGVNVIVDKPKRGDIMCIDLDPEVMRVKKVVWIDGLSINLKQLSGHYEAIGICLSVKGNKAMVRYREERDMRWLAADYWVLESPNFKPGTTSRPVNVTINGVISENKFTYSFGEFDKNPLETFRDQLNAWFRANNYSNYIAQLEKDPNEFLQIKYQVVVYGKSTESSWKGTFGIGGLKFTTFRDPSQRSPLKCIKGYYLNNDFFNHHTGGCCRAKFYDYINANQVKPTGPMNSIDSVPDSSAPWPLSKMGATKEDFEHHEYCSFLRDHFANYDEYLESLMVKFPCGEGGTITEFPCGKENTYILNGYTIDNHPTNYPAKIPLYPAANWAASISFNHPKLSKGNWWLPSSAEMAEIMRDITYNTSFWDSKPDIINRVLEKLTSISNSGWSMLDPNKYRWTSSQYNNEAAYFYDRTNGNLAYGPLYREYSVAPITIYEF